MPKQSGNQIITSILKTLINEYGIQSVEESLKLLSLEIKHGLSHGLEQISDKLPRIKYVKKMTGMGLKEAKEFVEENFSDNGHGSKIQGCHICGKVHPMAITPFDLREDHHGSGVYFCPYDARGQSKFRFRALKRRES